MDQVILSASQKNPRIYQISYIAEHYCIYYCWQCHFCEIKYPINLIKGNAPVLLVYKPAKMSATHWDLYFSVSVSLPYESITALMLMLKESGLCHTKAIRCHCDCFLLLLQLGNMSRIWPNPFATFRWLHGEKPHCCLWLYTDFTAVSFATISTRPFSHL